MARKIPTPCLRLTAWLIRSDAERLRTLIYDWQLDHLLQPVTLKEYVAAAIGRKISGIRR